jgi:GTP cyclohydrolase I
METNEASKTRLTWEQVKQMTERIPSKHCYGVPRGGSVVAALHGMAVDRPEDADIIVDDIVDSGRTREKWTKLFPDKPFYALVDKTNQNDAYSRNGWIEFPWEQPGEVDIQDAVLRILEYIGEDPKREGLRDTPERVVRSWRELFAGYHMKAEDVLKREFERDGYDEMIMCRHIDFYSTCEHHLQPFFGTAHVAYIPKEKVVGLSKLARLVDVFARRLQIQERLTEQIASALENHLQPLGVAVLIEAKHFCMMCRGVQKQNSCMTTSSLKGVFRNAEPRAEFLSLVAR